jgi:hypothetical protein
LAGPLLRPACQRCVRRSCQQTSARDMPPAHKHLIDLGRHLVSHRLLYTFRSRPRLFHGRRIPSLADPSRLRNRDPSIPARSPQAEGSRRVKRHASRASARTHKDRISVPFAPLRGGRPVSSRSAGGTCGGSARRSRNRIHRRFRSRCGPCGAVWSAFRARASGGARSTRR